MAAQEAIPGSAAPASGGRVGAGARSHAGARVRKDAARQREIFEAGRDELLAAHPGKYIAVCAGDVFAAPSVMGAVHMAARAHPGRAVFLYSQGHEKGQPTEEEAARLEERGIYAWRTPASPTPAEAARIKRRSAEEAWGRRETARQREIFEAGRDELLAAHPGRHIAVCAGEVFVADTAAEMDQTVMRAHPGRPSFQYSPGCACVSVF